MSIAFNIKEKIYIILCTFFTVLIIVGNLIYQKFVYLNIFNFYILELSIGAIFYPLTFLLTDLIAEFYGKERANFCVKLAIIFNIIVVLIISLMDKLEATNWSNVDNITFHKVFGSYHISFLASTFACYIAQLVDINIYLWIRKITKGKYLWIRNNFSTAISLFIDTFIVIGIMSLFNIFPFDQLGHLVLNSYSFKLFFTIFSTPVFYAGVWLISLFIKKGISF
ncbi:queuosine precursor transporter [Rickettsia helvetica]|uniref:Probable queuosine precursor transporter n=1 Tax=Rickettsia helvetica TaxID=35789 RepID=A0ABM9NBB1_RICHE|nr:queuosine precursor transporter [Rickettsia helvetica]MCZ6884014.1 queuosine precursor transporter [Rickettsia endosymbiont of Ixodes ricinus]MCZ6896717.1 queuosine precursor transporter [Rickettsia endosymbiont of Ixodes ricinus]